MKIYKVCAQLDDNVRGDHFFREFEFFLNEEKAIERKKELKKLWNTQPHITSAFYIREIEVIK